MPPYVRGGIWTNVEDEILKAAVSKYGLHQWSRVASLLVRKTARQCKARWDEFLNPTIVQTPWRSEDDRRLLSLAKVMPNRWRSIAPILGRTAVQCQERYLELITDQSAEASADDPGAGNESDDAEDDDESLKMLEARAARPDFVDMDDDEQEMLMEARARLANTKGKKAKRKERERYLEQQKRQSVLEERQAAKESGKSLPALKLKSSKFSVDYNAEIPFELAAPAGAHDTESEKRENVLEARKFGAHVAAGSPTTFGKQEKTIKHEQPTPSFGQTPQKRRRLELPASTASTTTTQIVSSKAVAPAPARARAPVPAPASARAPAPAPAPVQTVPVPTAAPVPRSRFLNLPAPKNDFELAEPDAPEVPTLPATALVQAPAERILPSVTTENLPQATSVSGKDSLKVEVQGLLSDPEASVLPAEKYYAAKALVDTLTESEGPAQSIDRTLIASPLSTISMKQADAALHDKLSKTSSLQWQLKLVYGELAAADESLAGFAALAEWERAGARIRQASLDRLLALSTARLDSQL